MRGAVMHPKTQRMRRIFRSDGRTLVVAMDHAGFMGPVAGLIDCPATVSAVVAGGADAVMTTLGTAKRILKALDGRGLILSVDLMAPDPVAVVENAIALGADSLKTLAFWGADDPAGMRNLGRYGVLCEKWGLPFQAEVIPYGFGATDKHTPEDIAISARSGRRRRCARDHGAREGKDLHARGHHRAESHSHGDSPGPGDQQHPDPRAHARGRAVHLGAAHLCRYRHVLVSARRRP